MKAFPTLLAALISPVNKSQLFCANNRKTSSRQKLYPPIMIQFLTASHYFYLPTQSNIPAQIQSTPTGIVTTNIHFKHLTSKHPQRPNKFQTDPQPKIASISFIPVNFPSNSQVKKFDHSWTEYLKEPSLKDSQIQDLNFIVSTTFSASTLSCLNTTSLRNNQIVHIVANQTTCHLTNEESFLRLSKIQKGMRHPPSPNA